jgi:hypothetical protein
MLPPGIPSIRSALVALPTPATCAHRAYGARIGRLLTRMTIYSLTRTILKEVSCRRYVAETVHIGRTKWLTGYIEVCEASTSSSERRAGGS